MHRTQPWLRVLAGSLFVLGPILIYVMPSSAAQGIVVRSSINGENTREIHASHPLKLLPQRLLTVHVNVRNGTGRPLVVHSIRLDSRVMGITFFAYETAVDMRLKSGASESRTFELNLVDLDHQATGWLPARLALLSPDRSVLWNDRIPVDVRGSARSVYASFGIAIVLITAVLLGSALFRLSTQRLNPNRSLRAARFGIAGLALGLTLTFGLSAFRVLLPTTQSWLTIVVVSGLVLFGLGYLTPTPGDRDPEDDREVEEETWPDTGSVDLRDTDQPWGDRERISVIDPPSTVEDEPRSDEGSAGQAAATIRRRQPPPPPT